MAVELGVAYVDIVASAKGIVGSITSALAPIEGIAGATGARAGTKLGGGLTNSLQGVLGAFPSASLGPLGSLLGAGLVVGFGAALAGIGREFATARSTIERETGLTGAALTATFDTVKTVMSSVPESISTVTTAVDELVRRGVPLGNTFDQLAKQELDLAHITGSDLASTVDTTTALFAKFNVPLQAQPAALDAIFKGYQASGQALSNLTGALQTGAATLTQYGFNIESSTALIAGLEKGGVNVTTALFGLRTELSKLLKAGQDPQAALKGLLDEFTNGTPKAQALGDAVKFFGARAGPELAAAISSGRLNTAALLKTITDGQGGILATAAATETFGEKLDILKNKALVALQPLASSVWSGIQTAVSAATGPVEAVASAFGHLLDTLSPIAPAIAVLATVGFGGALLVIDLFAKGIDTIASILGHIPGPALIVASALVVLASGFKSLQEALVSGQITSFIADFNPVVAGLVVAAAVITAIGGVVQVFGGKASAASTEAKDLGTALFAAAGSGALFAANITAAASGFADFLSKHDQAGKLKDLDNVLAITGVTLKDVATAVTGTSQQFEGLKTQLFDTSGLNAQQKALLGLSDQQVGVKGKIEGLTDAQIQQVTAVDRLAGALNTQRDAFVKSSEAALQLALRSGGLTAAQLAADEAIAHATTGVRGYGAATDIANLQIQGHTDALQKQAVQVALTSGTLGTAVDTFLKGGEDVATFTAALEANGVVAADATKIAKDLGDAQTAAGDAIIFTSTAAQNLASQFGAGAISSSQFEGGLLKLGATAGNTKTQVDAVAAGLDSFINAAVKLAPSLDTALTSAQKSQTTAQSAADAAVTAQANAQSKVSAAIDAAQQKVAAALAKGGASSASAVASAQANLVSVELTGKATMDKATADVVSTQAALVKSADPQQIVAALLKGLGEITNFETNLAKVVKEGGINVAQALATQGPAIAGASAAALAGDPGGVKLAEALTGQTQSATVTYTNFLKSTFGPEVAAEIEKQSGIAAKQWKPDLATPTTQAAAAVKPAIVAKTPEITDAVGTSASTASQEWGRRFLLANTTNDQMSGIHAAVTKGAPPVAAAAGSAATGATTSYASNLGVVGATTGAIAASVSAWNGQVTVDTANAARAAGRVVGFQFDKGIQDGINNGQGDVALAAIATATAIQTSIFHALGIASPSTVGIDIGENVVKGIAVGLARTDALAPSAATLAVATTAVFKVVDAAATAVKGLAPLVFATPIVPVPHVVAPVLPSLHFAAPTVPVAVVPTPALPTLRFATPSVPAATVAAPTLPLLHFAPPVVPVPVVPVPVVPQMPVLKFVPPIVPTPVVPVPSVPLITFAPPTVPKATVTTPALPSLTFPQPTVPAPVPPVLPHLTFPIPTIPAPAAPQFDVPSVVEAARRSGTNVAATFHGGIVVGLNTGQTSLATAATTAVSLLATAANTQLGIASSLSTVGVGIGEQFLAGMTVGLSHTDTLTSQSTKLATSLRANLAQKITALPPIPAPVGPQLAAASVATAKVAAVPPTPPVQPINAPVYHITAAPDMPTVQQLDIINRKQALRITASAHS